MTEQMTKFEYACEIYLATLGINDLRSYGREMGVARPTTKKKQELVRDILDILLGRIMPIEVSKQGAPVKNDRVDARIPARIEALRREYFPNGVIQDAPTYDLRKIMQEMRELQQSSQAGCTLRVFDPAKEAEGYISKDTLRGQIHFIEGEYRLLSENCTAREQTIRVPQDLMTWKGIREGDIISCYTRETLDGEVSVAEVVSVNDTWIDVPQRPVFDESAVCPADGNIRVCDGQKYASTALKFIQWLTPIKKGQRGCVISAPKAGKTKTLLQIAEAVAALNEGMEVYTLLVDQAPETVGEFQRTLGDSTLFYTTYEDDLETQVLMADMLLNRAKRHAETGKDVLLIVDSLTALARAFNDTDASSGGKTLSYGLEIKTVRYLKKYFGSARRLATGGSLTVLGAVSTQTGNPFDDVVCSEFSSLANYEIRLDNDLAMRRIYPAFNLSKISVKGEVLAAEKDDFDYCLRNDVLPRIGAEGLLSALEGSNSYEEFVKRIEGSL